ncbi:MAG: phosphopantetheine-binding protein [Alistipes sp.]|jgi:acyl carrier protein|nr:phosphopantetheine-binding protein [Alistipes sp.]
MNGNEIIEKINTVLADEFEIDAATITPDAPLMETLDMDSLDLVDVVVLVEQSFGITLRGEDFVGITTFREFYGLIEGKMNG